MLPSPHSLSSSRPQRLHSGTDGLRGAASRVERTGDRYVAELSSWLAASDPDGTVPPRSRRLCAGLAALAESAHAALGGRASFEIGRLAAMLSLLTKIEDQVIDSPAFHAPAREGELRANVRRFLSPSLRSIREGAPASAAPRCLLAAALGRDLAAIAERSAGACARANALLDWIAFGWEVQVEAVAVLTSHPSRVEAAHVERVSASISGVWLLAIAACGTVPADVSRGLRPREIAAFFRAGAFIQAADALADLPKDLAEGHRSSLPLKRLWDMAPDDYERAAASPEAMAAAIAKYDIDTACLASAEERARWCHELAALGDVGMLLSWIHEMLAARWWARDGRPHVRHSSS